MSLIKSNKGCLTNIITAHNGECTFSQRRFKSIQQQHTRRSSVNIITPYRRFKLKVHQERGRIMTFEPLEAFNVICAGHVDFHRW